MKMREILEKAILGTLNQGQKSITGMDHCAYRGKNNTKCAIGFLIKNKFYDADFEGVVPCNLEKHTPNSDNGKRIKALITALEQSVDHTFKPKELDQLTTLQECHDYAPDSDRFTSVFINNLKHKVDMEKLPKYCKDIAYKWEKQNA